MTQRSRPQLHYASPAPWHHRPHARRWALAAAGVLIACSAFFWGPRIHQRMQLLYLQHQCMTYAAPPSQIVFTDDPVEMPKLMAAGMGYHKAIPQRPVGVARDAPEWRAFLQGWSGFECGTIFCHRLKSPAGHERLVGVNLDLDDIGPELVPQAIVIEPAALLTLPKERVAVLAQGFTADFPGTHTFFAGQPDPADSSHFTFVYRHRDQDIIIDGWLNDNDSVSMQERRPGSPLSRPTPGSSR